MRNESLRKIAAVSMAAAMTAGTFASSVPVLAEEGSKEKITVAIYDRGTLNPDEGSMESNRWTEWINENAPVEVEFIAIPRWTSTDKYSTLFSSDSAPDLILEYYTGYLSSLITNECLMPLDDLIENSSTEYKALMEKYPIMRKMGTVDGELYYLCQCNPVFVNHTLVLRKDWLDKLGLEVPETADDFYNVISAFTTQDPDGNGEDDTWGYALSFVSEQIIRRMYDAADVWGPDENGELNYSWDNVKKAYEFEKKLYDEGIVSKDYAADTSGEQSTQDFVSGKLGAIGLNNGVVSTTIDNFYENNPDGELVVIPLPDAGCGKISNCLSTGCQVVGGINANCKNPEAVIKYIDWLNSSVDVYDMLKYGGTEYAEKLDNGAWVSKDSEKSAKEVYGLDYVMPISTIDYGYTQEMQLDQNSKYYDKKDQLYWEAYDSTIKGHDRIINQIIGNALPALDSMLTMINTSTYGSDTLSANWNKAIISGEDYTIEQAYEDNKKIVEDGGGDAVLEFYQAWYRENKDNLVTKEDIYALDNVEAAE